MDLTGERVRLRALRPDDAQVISANLADPELARFLGSWAWNPNTAEQVREFITRPAPNSVRWAVESLDDGVCLGATDLREIDSRNRNCLWGIQIGPPSRWGRGYGSEACRLATRFAFQHLGLEKVTLYLYEGNQRGRRACEKAGYRLEGSLPRDTLLDGALRTRHVMSAFRDDPIYAGPPVEMG